MNHFILGRESFKLCVSIKWKTQEFSDYQITWAYVDILDELLTIVFQHMQTHLLFHWEIVWNSSFSSGELSFDRAAST